MLRAKILLCHDRVRPFITEKIIALTYGKAKALFLEKYPDSKFIDIKVKVIKSIYVGAINEQIIKE